MERTSLPPSSSADQDRDQPVMLIATQDQFNAAGVQLCQWQPVPAALAARYVGFAPGNIFVHRDLILQNGSTKASEDDGLLSADEVAKRMKCTPQAVYHREQASQFFSVIPPGRKKGRKYPEFQLDPRLDDKALKRLIVLFKQAEPLGVTSNDLWNFLRTLQTALQGNTALNALLGLGTGATQADGGDMIFELAEEEIATISS